MNKHVCVYNQRYVPNNYTYMWDFWGIEWLNRISIDRDTCVWDTMIFLCWLCQLQVMTYTYRTALCNHHVVHIIDSDKDSQWHGETTLGTNFHKYESLRKLNFLFFKVGLEWKSCVFLNVYWYSITCTDVIDMIWNGPR